MLVWKTQTLNINVASLRYRCLLPLRYLARRGISSKIYDGADTVELIPQTSAIVFVKSFHPLDVETCERAYQQGIPIILDLCDNIFVDGYGVDSDYSPAQNFQLMAKRATAIVTTGPAMQAEVENALGLNGSGDDRPFVVTIPDGSEAIDDIHFAFRRTKNKRILRCITQLLAMVQRSYKQGKRKLKGLRYRIKRKVSQRLQRHYGLFERLPVPLDLKPIHNETAIDNKPVQKITIQATTIQETAIQATAQGPISQKAHKKQKNQSILCWPRPWPTAPGLQTVLWFGNHGAGYGNFGMLDILSVADALAAVNKSCPLRLVVVSNHRNKYELHIAPLPFATDYLPWHPRKIYSYIASSNVVIIPNSRSAFSICKSANRAVLSLSQGTPVIASHTPALDMLQGCVWLNDWESGLRAYLMNPEVAQTHVAQAQEVIAQKLSGDAIAQAWINLLNSLSLNHISNPL
ncbi:MAG: hypothetical protein AAF703_05190 [Cyanobacteria bacterium P01_D01_bin.105]